MKTPPVSECETTSASNWKMIKERQSRNGRTSISGNKRVKDTKSLSSKFVPLYDILPLHQLL